MRSVSMVEEQKLRNRILIAEDDPISRHMLQFFLVKWGYQVTAAADGTGSIANSGKSRGALSGCAGLDDARDGGAGRMPARQGKYQSSVRLHTSADGAQSKSRHSHGPGIGRGRLSDEALQRAGTASTSSRGPAHPESAGKTDHRQGRIVLSRHARCVDGHRQSRCCDGRVASRTIPSSARVRLLWHHFGGHRPFQVHQRQARSPVRRCRSKRSGGHGCSIARVPTIPWAAMGERSS